MLRLALPKSPILLHRINPRKSLNLFLHKMSWACKKCTFINSPSSKSTCQICLSSSPPASPTPSPPPDSAPRWPCKACTFLNPYPTTNCQICDTRRPVLASASIKELVSVDDEELDSSVGSVFMPLRACKRTKMEDCSESSDGFHEIKAGNEARSLSLDGDDNDDASQEVVKLKIMSYNVWFREDLEVHARMRAIGDLIQLHSPDIICLQEVTPDIYELFRSHKWWKEYRCSVSENEAQLRGYFCIQLSKLSSTTFSCRPFGNSAMGRELCVADAETSTGQSLVVATSHLESPCPAPPKWDQMFSKERVQQAKEALAFLGNYPNVIFCGDMNWDDKLDGPFPVLEGWVDAWMELKPGEDGWTYDTKSNKMLSENRKLQKRLDRFLCCLRDYKVADISMIGTEAIADLRYVKEKKVKGEKKPVVLPVLPSDHYGLLLTVTSL
uniref:RanBP2-type domain-containing protein n=1 Tax=Kalanchoe fedtschenkoi TaxID=63787 RepID=A0A7N0TMV8_KALFE